MHDLGMVEDQIFKTRQSKEQMFKMRDKQRKMQQQAPNFTQMHNSQFKPTPLGRGIQPAAIQNPRQEAARFRMMANPLDAMVTPVSGKHPFCNQAYASFKFHEICFEIKKKFRFQCHMRILKEL